MDLMQDFEILLQGETIKSEINERVVFDQLEGVVAVYSLLLAAGYLKIVDVTKEGVKEIYTLGITNAEVRITLSRLVLDWFFMARSACSSFIKALEACDLQNMNHFMNEVAFNCFSIFDTGGTAETSEPERFYHGFVLGLLVELRDRYILTSNRESGKGRYDVMLEPREPKKNYGFILEFKVHRPEKEKSLEDTVVSALAQIEERHYDQQLIERGIPADRIRKYGFAFKGKEVLIGNYPPL